MNTPIYDFLVNYAASDFLRCHMPGHKGIGDISRFDITEIKGADSLFEADGIILESEKNMALLYNAEASFYSTGGSTLCIQAMLMAMKRENRKIIALRNAHRAFINCCALIGLDVEWILPDYKSGILSGEINTDEIEKKISENKNSCVYLTSPDYTGRIADIKKISAICHKYNAPLLVDNAHGSHLHFFEKSLHPIALGADMCCDSAHKMLIGLTGSAVLHTSDKKYAKILRQCMSMFASTSPSYLILASLDLCCDYIDKKIRHDIAENLVYINDLRMSFSDIISECGDPFHITINAYKYGYSGNDIAENLRKNGIECEYSDENIVILLMSPMNRKDDYIKLGNGLRKALESAEKKPVSDMIFLKKLPEKAMSISLAAYSEYEEISVENAEGRICAAVNVPCPPAIPIAVSGEIINRECIEIYKKYGIKKVMVVK